MSLQELQTKISSNLTNLKNKRDTTKKTYFIEHGEDADYIIDSVKERISIDGKFNNTFWSKYPLPLICFLSEVGYNYRGTGTDFWPLASSKIGDLNAFNSGDTRRFIAKKFEDATYIYNGSAPDFKTPWASKFKHIAWPIHHAVLPKEHQVALVEFIAQRREGLDLKNITDVELHNWIKSSSQNIGIRFRSWLEQQSVVSAILRALFGGEQGILEPSFVERVTSDLLHDLRGRDYLITSARTRLIQASHPRKAPQPDAEVTGELRGYFAARVSDHHWLTLELFLPKLPSELEGRCAAVLRRQFYTPRLWGRAAPISLSVFLRGDCIPLVFQDNTLPSDDTPILVDLPGGLSADDQRALLNRSVSWKFPKLLIDEDNGYYVERSEAIVFHGERALLLTTAAEEIEVEGITLLDQKAFPELRALLVDTSIAAAADWCRLRSLLSERRRNAQLIAGAPQLAPRKRQLTFLTGDQLYFALMPDDGERLAWGSGAVTAEADELLGCSVGDDPALLSLWIHEGERRAELARYELQAGTRPAVCPICWVELQGALTTEALLSGSPKLLIRALRPLDHARLHLSLYIGAAQRPCAVTCIDVYGLPCVLPESSRVWAELLDGLELRGVNDHLRLELRLGTLWSGELLFEATNWEFWWEMEDGAPVLRDEDESLLTICQSAASALLAPLTPMTRDNAQEGIFLFTAARDGQPLLYGGLCLNVGRSTFASSRQAIADIEQLTARLRRQLSGDADGVGVWELAGAYLRWRCASAYKPSKISGHTVDMFAESVRRQAVSQLHGLLIEALCGRRWAEVEEGRHIIDAQQLFVKLCFEHNMFSLSVLGSRRATIYTDLISSVLYETITTTITKTYSTIKQHEDTSTTNELVEQRENELEALIALIRSGGSGWAGEKDHYAMLDELLSDALEECSWRCFITGDHDGAQALDEPDVGNTSEDWEVLFRRMRLRLNRNRSYDDLRHLLQPASGFAELAEFPYEELTHEQLIQELDMWRQRHTTALQGRRWEHAEIEQIAMLWLDPERAAHFRSIPERALSDRSMARAIRYAVIRHLDANILS